jgi:hypothetical protein
MDLHVCSVSMFSWHDRDIFIVFTQCIDILDFLHCGRGCCRTVSSLVFLAWISLFVMLTGELLLCCEVTVAESIK